MPYTDPYHELYTFKGAMPGGDIWSVGLRAVGATVYGAANLLARSQAISDRFATMRNSLQTATSVPWPDGVTYTGCTGRVINQLGRTTQQADVISALAPAGALPKPKMPNQCAIVVSLLTAQAGRSAKGRIYLPLIGDFMNTALSTGRHTASASILAIVKTFIQGVNGDFAAGSGSTTHRFSVMSKTAGTGYPITGIRVGDVVDTQRRRRSALPEVYTYTTV